MWWTMNGLKIEWEFSLPRKTVYDTRHTCLDWVSTYIRFYNDNFFSLLTIITFWIKDPFVLLIKQELITLFELTFLIFQTRRESLVMTGLMWWRRQQIKNWRSSSFTVLCEKRTKITTISPVAVLYADSSKVALKLCKFSPPLQVPSSLDMVLSKSI